MLNELDLLSQNIDRLLEISDLYQRDLQELQQRFAHTCIVLEQIRSECDTLRAECETLRAERDLSVTKIENAQILLHTLLESLSRDKLAEHQADLAPTINSALSSVVNENEIRENRAQEKM